MNKKHYLARPAAAALSLTMLWSAVAAAPLSDIQGHWAEKNITRWVEAGKLLGYEDGTFYAHDSLTGATSALDECISVRVSTASSYWYVTSDVADPEPSSITGATVSVDSEEAYTGESVEPAVTVTLGSKTLVEGTDYTVSYADNVEVGTATVTVTGTGDYAGVSKANFQIESGTTLIQRACNTATTAASSSSLSSGVTI